MKNLHLSPAWFFTDDNGEQLDPRLFALLRAILEHNKLTEAAQACDLSYRHAWNMLDSWGTLFGTPLVEKHKGRGSRLSPMGEKLLWAERRVAARLEPQLESLASEINLEFARLLEGNKPILRMHASHGYAVALLPRLMSAAQFDLQYCSPSDALAALSRNACDLAGFHIPINIDVAILREYRKRLKPRSHCIIQFITRNQGLMVTKENPKNIQALSDLAQPSTRFINRQSSAGTRVLLDALLMKENINNKQIAGYEQEEFTHSAVAAYIAAGMADVGFGVEAAARQFGLEFIPLAKERYVFACHAKLLTETKMTYFLDILRSKEFSNKVAELPGYNADDCGGIYNVGELSNS